MFAVRDIILFAVVAGLLSAVALAIWPWSRRWGRFVVGAAAVTGVVAMILDLFVL